MENRENHPRKRMLTEMPLVTTLRLVMSSERCMPAHFCSHGECKQSFCIDFPPLSESLEYNMASYAYDRAMKVLDVTQEEIFALLPLGENLMVGTFILANLNGKKNIRDLVRVNLLQNLC